MNHANDISIEVRQVMDQAVSFLKDNSPIIVTGVVGSGKTRFVNRFLKTYFKSKKVAVIEPIDEYIQLKDHMNDLTTYETDTLNSIISEVISANYDLVVIDEAGRFDSELIHSLYKSNQRLILIYQVFDATEHPKLGSPLFLNVNRYRNQNVVLHEVEA